MPRRIRNAAMAYGQSTAGAQSMPIPMKIRKAPSRSIVIVEVVVGVVVPDEVPGTGTPHLDMGSSQ
jgi:hypothetical protein